MLSSALVRLPSSSEGLCEPLTFSRAILRTMLAVTETKLPTHFYQGAITHFTREEDVQGEGTWIVLHCANGGRICVLTTHPLVFVDPEPH